jgi:cell pole-organizing protein PopZ
MIRFLKVSSPYPEFLAHAYAAKPDLSALPYAAQLQRLLEWRFAYSDFWKRHLEATGYFEATEIIANAAPLQYEWARNHDLDADPTSLDGWRKIVFAQVREFQPEILFLHGGFAVTPAFRRLLKAEVPSIRLLMGYDGVAADNADMFAGCDVVLSCLEESVKYYHRAGFQSRLIKNAFEPSMTALGNGLARDNPVLFSGSVQFGRKRHRERARVLAEVSRRVSVRYRLSLPTGQQFLRQAAGDAYREHRPMAVLDNLVQIRDFLQLRRVAQSMSCGVDMYRELARSQVVLNVHIDAAGAAAANMRLFEATGMGACLVTDWKANITEHFEEDREIVTFRSVGECCEKIEYLLSHADEREAIAARGRQRTLRDHRLDRELTELAEYLHEIHTKAVGA